jgi:hypothetical protein
MHNSQASGESGDLDLQLSAGESADSDGTGHRLANLEKLYHVPVFALRELLQNKAPGRALGELRQAALVAEADRLPEIEEADIDALYENYRYGRQLAFYLYLLPNGLSQPERDALQPILDELAGSDQPRVDDEVAASEDYESDSSPNQVVLLDEENVDGIREIRYRYYTLHRFLNAEEQPDEVLQTRYGFLWLDLDVGYVTILSRDERLNRLLIRALSTCLQTIPLPVRLPKELVDKHFSIENVRRLSHYDPGTGVRQSLSGRGLWKDFNKEILARERHFARPSSFYEEEVAEGVLSGLGVTASKGKIYLTKTLPTSVVRDWAIQRLPDLVRDVKNLRDDSPEDFSRSMEIINRMRLPATGKAVIIEIAEALLQTEREELTSVQLSQTALELYDALAGKYFNPYLRVQCDHCEETAELCPHCESQALDLKGQRVICKECGSLISDEDSVTLKCMNGHITRTPLADAFGIAPNHWLQKRMSRIFEELGQAWSERLDYFHIEGSMLFRLRRGEVERGQLPGVVQNYISNFWEPVVGQVHAGRGDIIAGSVQSTGDSQRASGEPQPEGHLNGGIFEQYENLDLRLRGNATAGYTVEAIVSDGGSVPPQPLILPHDEAFRQQLIGILRQSTSEQDIQAVGKALFHALFPTPILKLWARAVGGLKDNAGLRLRLHIDPPELTALPWELLFDEDYIGLRLRFPVVRYMDLPDSPKALAILPPVRLLVAISQPRDQRSFDANVELANIRKAAGQLGRSIEMDVMEHATCDELLARLRQGYHALHYLGHGTFEGNEGYLILEGARGRSDPVSALTLGQMVADTSLRLVTLSACVTSLAGPRGIFGGVAQQMVKGGIPAVVAMQMAISDRTAIAFSREFYGALAEGWPIDAAVQQGRRGIMIELDRDWIGHVDWAIPTLYMRAPDGMMIGIRGNGNGRKEKKEDVAGTNNQRAQSYSPVYGAAHAGTGDIRHNMFQVGMREDDVGSLFQSLREQVEAQAPSDKEETAEQQVDALEKAIEQDEPDVGTVESVVNWFKKHLPQLTGTVTSVVLNPVVGKIVEAAGGAVAEGFGHRLGKATSTTSDEHK